MKKDVSVIVDDSMIYVDGVALECQFKPHIEKLHAIQWHNGYCDIEIKGSGNRNGSYETDVKPYVEVWQKAFDEIEAERIAQEEYEASFENQYNIKLSELKSAFETASENAHCMSSVGFEINADAVAKRNIDGLIEKMEERGIEHEMFRAYDNTFHQVTVSDLKAMRLDVIDNANALYQRKWTLEAQINACTTVEELDAINIDFEV